MDKKISVINNLCKFIEENLSKEVSLSKLNEYFGDSLEYLKNKKYIVKARDNSFKFNEEKFANDITIFFTKYDFYIERAKNSFFLGSIKIKKQHSLFLCFNLSDLKGRLCEMLLAEKKNPIIFYSGNFNLDNEDKATLSRRKIDCLHIRNIIAYTPKKGIFKKDIRPILGYTGKIYNKLLEEERFEKHSNKYTWKDLNITIFPDDDRASLEICKIYIRCVHIL